MVKQRATETCRYVINYPFQLMEKRTNNEIHTVTGTGESTRGRLPIGRSSLFASGAGRQSAYINEFLSNSFDICTVEPEDNAGPTIRFCRRGSVLQAPIDTPVVEEEVVVTGNFATFQCGTTVSGQFGCTHAGGTGENATGFFIIGDGTNRTGTSELFTCNADVVVQECTSNNSQLCVQQGVIPSTPTGTVQFTWQTITGVQSQFPFKRFWAGGILSFEICAFDAGGLGSTCISNAAGISTDNYICGQSIIGPIRVRNEMIAGSIGRSFDMDWPDGVDEDGNIGDNPVLNWPIP